MENQDQRCNKRKVLSAEYLTAMYDASLDVFTPNKWSFSVLQEYYSSLPWDVSGGFKTSSGLYYPLHYTSGEYFTPSYEKLNWFGFGLGGANSGSWRWKILPSDDSR